MNMLPKIQQKEINQISFLKNQQNVTVKLFCIENSQKNCRNQTRKIKVLIQKHSFNFKKWF